MDYYRTLDQHMSPESLRDVVNRITEAMPKSDGALPPAISTVATCTVSSCLSVSSLSLRPAAAQGDTTQRLGFASSADAPLTSTPMASGRRGPGPDISGHASSGEQGSVGEGSASPLPDEWEELIDQDTKHRFFANHKTRQTSWTDPRDKLVTVNLVKGGKGLGLGISGAKVRLALDMLAYAVLSLLSL